MNEWSEENKAQSLRTKWAGILASELEQLEENFVTGTIDRDGYAKAAQELNERLSIVGLSLVNQPWKTAGNTKF